jgi:flagellar motor component MotA
MENLYSFFQILAESGEQAPSLGLVGSVMGIFVWLCTLGKEEN